MCFSDFTYADTICKLLQTKFPDYYEPVEFLPHPFCTNKANVKAIVLGTDPSNRFQKRFQYVFGLGGSDRRYFNFIQHNLNEIGLSLDEIYVQNLCRNYSRVETSKNPKWYEIAKQWVPVLKDELDESFDRNIPVLITAWEIFKVLAINPGNVKPCFFYNNLKIIDFSENFLNRQLIPFFRHHYYDLSKWREYCEHIQKVVCT